MLDGLDLQEAVAAAGRLLATVLGQDLEQADDGVFRIARKVARDRVISTVDPQARHGHKTSARGFDGYKGHIAIDPDSELVTATVVTPGNAGDAAAAPGLVADLAARAGNSEPAGQDPGRAPDAAASDGSTTDGQDDGEGVDRPVVYGDAAYGAGVFLEHLGTCGIESRCKTQPPPAAGGMFSKDQFEVDLDAGTVTCPNAVTVAIGRDSHGDGTARFGLACAGCPLAGSCTTAKHGRTVAVSRHEARLAANRRAGQDRAWRADYRATRPKVERRIGQLMRRRHGGRRARMRGQDKIAADFSLLAAAHNMARLAVLGIRSTATGWATATT